MDHFKSISEIGLGIDELRMRLKKGLHSYAEGMAMLCTIFYYDMVVIMKQKSVPNHGTVFHLLENYRTCADVLLEYSSCSDEEKRKHGKLMAFGIIQSISQVVETTRYIHRLIGLDYVGRFKVIKQTAYWRFRNWHTHAEPFNLKITNEFSVIPGTKIFTSERTSANAIAYVTIENGGWSGNVAKFDTMLNDMRWDFEKLFAEIVEKCRAEEGDRAC